MSDVLVLSRDFQPLQVVDWQRAVTLLTSGLVEAVEEYDDWVVRSVSLTIRVPAVIRYLAGKLGWRKRGVRFSRENIFARDKGKCAYCRQPLTHKSWTADHVIPRAQGGQTRWDNIVSACAPCNQQKGNRTPAEAKMQLHAKPTRPASLPGGFRLPLPTEVPMQWRDYLQSFAYWNLELESDA